MFKSNIEDTINILISEKLAHAFNKHGNEYKNVDEWHGAFIEEVFEVNKEASKFNELSNLLENCKLNNDWSNVTRILKDLENTCIKLISEAGDVTATLTKLAMLLKKNAEEEAEK